MTHKSNVSDFMNKRSVVRLAGLLLAVCVIFRIATVVGVLSPPLCYRKDLVQDYLAARAILDGKNPYELLPVLRERYLADFDYALTFPHPTPHPPAALLVTLPLGLTTYPRAAVAWLCFESVLLVASCLLIARRIWGTNSVAAPLLLAALAVSSCPFHGDLMLGQFGVLVLALLVASYVAVSGGREVTGGLWLGAAVSLKFLGWPIVLFYAWKRRWRVVAGAGAALIVVHIAAFCVLSSAVLDYYRHVAPGADAGYSASDGNISVWTVGQRVFGGLYSQAIGNSIIAPPFIALPALARPVGMLAALATFLVCLRIASKLRDRTDGFLVMLCISTVLNPIAWEIYLTLLLLPLAVVGWRLAQRSWPPRATLTFAALVLFLIALRILRQILLHDAPAQTASAALALISAVPMLVPLTTAWLVAGPAAADDRSTEDGRVFETDVVDGDRPHAMLGATHGSARLRSVTSRK